MLIATGTGVTVAYDLIERVRCTGRLPQSVLILFTTRSATLFASALETFCRRGGLPDGITVKMFLTDPSVDKIVVDDPQLDSGLHMEGVSMTLGRADFNTELYEVAASKAPHEVFFCGGNRILDVVQEQCRKHNHKLFYDPPYTG